MSKELKCPKCGEIIGSIEDFVCTYNYESTMDISDIMITKCSKCNAFLPWEFKSELRNIMKSVNKTNKEMNMSNLNLSALSLLNAFNFKCDSRVRLSIPDFKLCIPGDNGFYVKYCNGRIELIPSQLTTEFNLAIPMFTELKSIKCGDIACIDNEVVFVSKVSNVLECVNGCGKVSEYMPVGFMNLTGFNIISSSNFMQSSTNSMEDIYKMMMIKKFL